MLQIGHVWLDDVVIDPHADFVGRRRRHEVDQSRARNDSTVRPSASAIRSLESRIRPSSVRIMPSGAVINTRGSGTAGGVSKRITAAIADTSVTPRGRGAGSAAPSSATCGAPVTMTRARCDRQPARPAGSAPDPLIARIADDPLRDRPADHVVARTAVRSRNASLISTMMPPSRIASAADAARKS